MLSLSVSIIIIICRHHHRRHHQYFFRCTTSKNCEQFWFWGFKAHQNQTIWFIVLLLIVSACTFSLCSLPRISLFLFFFSWLYQFCRRSCCCPPFISPLNPRTAQFFLQFSRFGFSSLACVYPSFQSSLKHRLFLQSNILSFISDTVAVGSYPQRR